ncbi:MAG: polyribonucleotide nucleotidyltransferase [Candidatus Eisenbacteria bacterium]|nr:polyribonucleotide nucleotidyltransferase [Candidatus Eisenbacteria bacterium]
MHKLELELGGRPLTVETGRLAKQASGAVLVTYADTVLLATVVIGRTEIDRDFLPLTVDYRERTYAAGRIPGGFFKREGRPTEKEILSSRLIDRSLRPFFEKSNRYEIQIQVDVLSSDQENDSDVIGMLGASAAVCLSDMPFPVPLAAVRVGLVGGELVVNPTTSELEESRVNIVVAGTEDSIVMVEGESREISEAQLVEIFNFAHRHIAELCRLQSRLVAAAGKPKRTLPVREIDPGLKETVAATYRPKVEQVVRIAEKMERERAMDGVRTEALAQFAPVGAADTTPDRTKAVAKIVDKLESEVLRKMVLDEGVRADGRKTDQIRPITCEVGVLPRTHGSALFTRGQTQALVVATLGTSVDEQRIEELTGQSWKTFMLHYNFPPFSVGETRPNRGPGRREIGHGALAERALSAVVPANERFPYTIRIVSDILESNGSSSMASVCGGSLSLMDAGVPIKSPVAGIAMGLVKDGDQVAILSDIMGIEDHIGDMDFKIAGTEAGITAIQMDIKIKGLDFGILTKALEQARQGRIHILGIMNQTLADSRKEISVYAPRIIVIKINPDKIRDVIGPGGKMIKKICEETGAQIDVEDDGTVKVACVDSEMANRAVDIIRALTEDPEIGRTYRGKVKRIVNFGAFVEILPGRDGLVHISELENHRVARVEDVLAEGDVVLVKVIGVDEEGKIRLSRRAVLQEAAE